MKWTEKIQTWSFWTPLFSGVLPRISMVFPLFGYLILANDSVSDWLVFKSLTADESGVGLSTTARMQLMYFGLFFLGIGSAIFSVRKPQIFELGSTAYSYVDAALKYNTTSHYYTTRKNVLSESKDPEVQKTLSDFEWGAFFDDTAAEETERTKKGLTTVERSVGSWQEAKNKYTDILIYLLEVNFALQNKKRFVSLLACLAFGLFGYILMAIPSIDLFVKVLRAVFFGDPD